MPAIVFASIIRAAVAAAAAASLALRRDCTRRSRGLLLRLGSRRCGCVNRRPHYRRCGRSWNRHLVLPISSASCDFPISSTAPVTSRCDPDVNRLSLYPSNLLLLPSCGGTSCRPSLFCCATEDPAAASAVRRFSLLLWPEELIGRE